MGPLLRESRWRVGWWGGGQGQVKDAGSHKVLSNHSKALRTPSVSLSHRGNGVHPQSHKLCIWVKLSKKDKGLHCTQVLTEYLVNGAGHLLEH